MKKTKFETKPGLVFAPYLPMNLPVDFSPRESLTSRYSIKKVNNRYYGALDFTDPDMTDEEKLEVIINLCIKEIKKEIEK